MSCGAAPARKAAASAAAPASPSEVASRCSLRSAGAAPPSSPSATTAPASGPSSLFLLRSKVSSSAPPEAEAGVRVRARAGDLGEGVG